MDVDVKKYHSYDISSMYPNTSIMPDVLKVDQIDELTFRFFTFFQKDINDWIRESKHTNIIEKRDGKTTIRFSKKSGAVEFKLRFIGL